MTSKDEVGTELYIFMQRIKSKDYVNMKALDEATTKISKLIDDRENKLLEAVNLEVLKQIKYSFNLESYIKTVDLKKALNTLKETKDNDS